MFKIMNVFSKPSIQIILYLGRRYRDGYYVREISRNLGISLGSASQSLRTLEEAGLVLKEHRGRLVIYRANMQNFLLREFKILLTLLEIYPFILRLKEISSSIILFGSCATGEDTIDSDIDILIESDNKREITRLHDRYQEDIPRKISPIILDSTEFRNLRILHPLVSFTSGRHLEYIAAPRGARNCHPISRTKDGLCTHTKDG